MKQKVGELKGGENLSRIECACGAIWIPYGNKKLDAEEREKFIEKHKDHEILDYQCISQTWTVPDADIRNRDIWKFIQDHKNKTPDELGGWLIGQSVNPTDKIVKAICAWNERQRK